MMATYNLTSSIRNRQKWPVPSGMKPAILCCLLAFIPLSLWGMPPEPPLLTHSNYARQVYIEKKLLTEIKQPSQEAHWKFAKACFDYADFSIMDTQREPLALEGIKAARHAAKLAPTSAQAHYTLALNLGQLARTRTLSALQIVQEMEREFFQAIALDPKIDHAGPHRALGILYRDAPGWPISLGNRKKAESHLQKALKLFPEYPGNSLSFLELLVELEAYEKICPKIPATQKILDQARKNLTGPAWASSWDEWESRWTLIKSQIACN
jgi:tetratricopeptide (TPR) repeat protein